MKYNINIRENSCRKNEYVVELNEIKYYIYSDRYNMIMNGDKLPKLITDYKENYEIYYLLLLLDMTL